MDSTTDLEVTQNQNFTPVNVREILGMDNRTIARLCRRGSVMPKKDNNGNTYFSYNDVETLKKIKDSFNQAFNIEMEKTPDSQTISNKQSLISVEQKSGQQLPTSSNNFSEILNSIEASHQSLVDKISKLIDDKLDGMDEVVVELIRCKTENESFRQKFNDLYKENYNLKKELKSFKPCGFGFFTKKNNTDTDSI